MHSQLRIVVAARWCGRSAFATVAWIAVACAALSTEHATAHAQSVTSEFTTSGLSAHQRTQLDTLQSARQHGLEPANYDVAALARMASDPDTAVSDQFAVRLKAAFNRYAFDVRNGRRSPRTDPDWHIPQRPTFANGQPPVVPDIAALPPPHPDYQRLHGAMIRYLAIQEGGGWTNIPPGPNLFIGVLHPQAALARARLRMTGDYTTTAPANSHLFASGLDAATKSFQARHGLRVSGIIDTATREAMNVSIKDRIAQLAVAMERWRWLPRDLGDEYVWVNAAQATLDFVVNRSTVLSMRTIVGHSTRPTPSLQSEIRRVVFNPSWSVPYTIATEDLLPKLRKDRDFLTRNGFRIYTGRRDDIREVDPAEVNWSDVSADRFPYRFSQRPGPSNSLGRVKIVFDNPYDIYIHDTPAKGLFSLRTRTFSSGCVRLEQATDFVNALLANDRKWGNADTQQYLGDQRTRGINLQRNVPIYIVYITSWVSEDGQAHFRRDLYRRDTAVVAASAGIP